MTPAELYDRFRLNVVDTERPYLWTDDEVYSYLDDAQKMFYRLTRGIAGVMYVPFTAGDTFVPISDRILKIRRAALTSDGRPLRLANFEQLETEPRHAYDYDYGPGSGFRDSGWSPLQLDATPGIVTAVVLGMVENQLRLVRVPDTDGELELVVEREPLEDITESSTEFEVPAKHHLHLLLWAEHLAYMKQDSETVDKAKAEKRKTDFEAYCAMSMDEKNRQRHVPRAVAYGGI